MRVFSAGLATETNTFSPLPTGMDAFQQCEFYPAGQHPDHMSLYGGQLWAARERGPREGWTLFEGLTSSAEPGGVTTRATYETLRDQMLDDLKAALPLDMVLLGLHGAMVAEGYDDCEGDIIARARQIVGPKAIIGVELDPHCHLTPMMIDNCNILLAYKEYPHTDVYECGVELVDLCTRIAKGEVKPVSSLADTGMIIFIRTTTEPGLSIVSRMKEMEQQDKVLSVSIAQGFPWADVPEMGTRVIVYTDGDAELAQRLARELADDLYAMRDEIAPAMPTIDEALDQALAEPAGPVVIADTADNAGGGSASDSTFFLQRMLERKIDNAALGPVWDPIAVQICFAAGQGASLPLRIGGKVGPASGQPVDVYCKVIGLKRNLVMTGLGGVPQPMGDCALVDCNGIAVLLASWRSQAINTDLFSEIGCDLRNKRIVVVKSTQHFRDSYEKIASAIIYAAAEGSVSFDLARLPFKNIQRPKWPVDL